MVSFDRYIHHLQPWRVSSWQHFPNLPVIALIGSMTSITLALVVLLLADNSIVNGWPLAPPVYLSIIATLSNTMLRLAYYESADLFWWSRLLSAVSLRELHTMWDLIHNFASLAQFPARETLHLHHLHLTAVLILLLAVIGPFLQRIVTVEPATREYTRAQVELPIRREPTWNLTTFKIPVWINPKDDGICEATPVYSDEFA